MFALEGVTLAHFGGSYYLTAEDLHGAAPDTSPADIEAHANQILHVLNGASRLAQTGLPDSRSHSRR